MTTKEDFWERKNKLNDDFFVLGSVGKPATESQISAYEQSSGYRLSEDFRDFLLTFGSLIFEVTEEVWKRPDEFDVLATWKFGYGFFVYGLSQDEEMPSWMTLQEKQKEALGYKEKPLGQLFFKRSGNLYRAYTDNGMIKIEYDKYADNDFEIFEGNIYDFLIKEIDKLEEDYKEYINEEKPE